MAAQHVVAARLPLPLLILASLACLSSVQAADTLTCYKCSDSRDLSLCLSSRETCSSTQSCYKQETTGPMHGIVEKYSMGCMDANTCARQPQSTARDLCDNAGQSCYSCCRDRSFCNAGHRLVAVFQLLAAALVVSCSSRLSSNWLKN